ncbi:MAG: extracellular solute-binding protein [Treponema sp.]|jgi:multiple sugar transport system substrate-binding protein|nr:extracellular solute-binding protein [Treponema sp.]
MEQLKRILVFLAAAALMAGLSSCGGKKEAAGSGGQVTIKIAQMMNEANSIDRLNEIFSIYTKEENPNVKIEATYISVNNDWADFITSISTMVAAGDAPDVILIAMEGFTTMEAAGLAAPLNKYLDANPEKKEYIFSNTPDALIGPFKGQDGSIYSTLMSQNNVVIHCNTELFREAGVEIPEPGSWGKEEFLEACKKLTKTKPNGEKQYAIFVPNQHFMFSAFAAQWGVDFLTPDLKKARLDSPQMIEMSKFLYDMIHTWKYSPIPQANDDDIQMLVDGRVAMILAGRWPTATYANNNFKDVRLTTIPKFDNDRMTYGADGYVVVSKTKHYDEAAAVAVWTSSPRFLREYLTTGNIPCNYDMFEEICGKTGVPENWELFYNMEYVKNCVSPQVPPAFADLSNIIKSYRTSIYAGETTDYAKAWAAANKEVDEAIANFAF